MKFNISFTPTGSIANPRKLNKIIDDQWISFLFRTGRKSVKYVKDNIRQMTWKKSTGKLLASNKAIVFMAQGLGSSLEVKNTARNTNTTGQGRVRYARYVEYGRGPIQGNPYLRFEGSDGKYHVMREVKAAPAKPFFIRGVRKAVDEQLDVMANKIEKQFNSGN